MQGNYSDKWGNIRADFSDLGHFFGYILARWRIRVNGVIFWPIFRTQGNFLGLLLPYGELGQFLDKWGIFQADFLALGQFSGFLFHKGNYGQFMVKIGRFFGPRAFFWGIKALCAFFYSFFQLFGLSNMSDKLTDTEQKKIISKLEGDKLRFSELYHRWVDNSSSVRKKISISKLMYGM